MNSTSKIIRGIAVTNIVILGLSGCTNTPTPWTEEDDSPWGAKREAEAQSIPSDDAVTDAPQSDPVLIAEPEPIVMQEPDAAPAPLVIVPVVVEEAATQDIMAMLSSNYAVQVFAGNTVESVDRFKAEKDLDDLITVKTDRSGSIIYVLVDIYPDRESANAAAVELEMKTGSKPWVRSLAGLQKIVAE